MGSTRFLSIVLAALSSVSVVKADEPLHHRIDAAIGSHFAGPLPGRCSDAEFLRRVTLDLHGTIPSTDTARAFLDDADPDKRAKLVDRLLADPAYAAHMAVVFDVMLLERRADKYVKTADWRAYLERSFAANKPWNELAAEVLACDGTDPDLHAAGRFVMDRDAEPNLVTRDVGRMFFGMDVQCAQCHDHPLVDDYWQSDYYGLLAFVGRTGVLQVDKKKPAVLSETAPVAVGFKSVFTEESGRTRPRLPGGTQIDEPYFPPGGEYDVAPAKNVRSVPKFSRRDRLAELVRTGENDRFRRNIVNRLWAHLFGRGIVHPVDMLHSDNPPSHPELLALLADDFAASGFDVRRFLREVVLTEAYQRPFSLPTDLASNVAAARKRLDGLEVRQEELERAANEAVLAWDALATKLDEANAALDPQRDALAKANEATKAALKPLDEARKAVAAKEAERAKKDATAKTIAEAATKADAVAKALPKDAEVVKAAAVLKDRSTKAAAEVTALAGQVAELQKKVEPVLAAYDKAAAAGHEVAAKLAEARKPVAALEAETAIARRKSEAAATAMKDANVKIAHLRELIAWDEARRTLEPLVVDHARIEAEYVAARDAAAGPAAEVAKLRAEKAAADKTFAVATQAFEEMSARFDAHTSAVSLMDDSVTKAEAALANLPTDESLTKSVADVRERAEGLRSRTALLEDEVEQLSKSLTEATAQRTAATEAFAKAEATWKPLGAKLTEIEPRYTEITARVRKARGAVDEGWTAIEQAWTNHGAVAVADPLSPEQLGRSVLEATGQIARQRAAVVAELDKKSPLSEADAKDPAKVAAREAEIAKQTRAKVDGLVAKFVQLFGASAGQPQDEFFATVDQALFFANGGEVRGWLNPAGDNLTGRLVKVEDPAAVADDLYLSILTRRPTDAEIADVTAFLADRTEDRPKAIAEMAWALLTSIEFRFQH